MQSGFINVFYTCYSEEFKPIKHAVTKQNKTREYKLQYCPKTSEFGYISKKGNLTLLGGVENLPQYMRERLSTFFIERNEKEIADEEKLENIFQKYQ